MPGRQYGQLGRHGFNGKEQDAEASGDGNQYDYGFRIYNPRISKFLSTDPLSKKYPELTPYQFASNTPIQSVDLDGLESVQYVYVTHLKKYGKTLIIPINSSSNGKPGFSAEVSFDNGKKLTSGIYARKEDLNEVVNFAAQRAAEAWNPPDGSSCFNCTEGIDNAKTVEDIVAEENRNYQEIMNGQDRFRGALLATMAASGALVESGPINNSGVVTTNSVEAGLSNSGSISERELLLNSKAKVFSQGGSIGILDGTGELNVNANMKFKRLTGQINVKGDQVFFEGNVNTENNVLTINNIGFRDAQGNYNSTQLVNKIGPGLFKRLLSELTDLKQRGGYKEGVLEYERTKPDGSSLPDRPTIQYKF